MALIIWKDSAYNLSRPSGTEMRLMKLRFLLKMLEGKNNKRAGVNFKEQMFKIEKESLSAVVIVEYGEDAYMGDERSTDEWAKRAWVEMAWNQPALIYTNELKSTTVFKRLK